MGLFNRTADSPHMIGNQDDYTTPAGRKWYNRQMQKRAQMYPIMGASGAYAYTTTNDPYYRHGPVVTPLDLHRYQTMMKRAHKQVVMAPPTPES